MAVNQECTGCGRTTRHRLARGLCTTCYQNTYRDDPNPVDPNGLAWTTTRPHLTDPDHTWWDQARCQGIPIDVFFPERGHDTRPAKNICNTCTVADRCLAYAEANNLKFGVWGGLSERERRNRRTRRTIEATAA